MASRRRIGVIGAGPKGLAIAAKCTVLQELGFDAPEIHLIERREVAANWTGSNGYTDGQQPLGTPPEKDLGFPYRSEVYGQDLNRAVDLAMQRYSWASHMIALGRYSDWVDRGRPAPLHREWAAYLHWVARQLGPNCKIHFGQAKQIAMAADRWQIQIENTAGEVQELLCDGLVVTGPGAEARAQSAQDDRVLDVADFWRRRADLRIHSGMRIALIGNGENAACIAASLLERRGDGQPQLDIVSPSGAVYSRGESYFENRVYSHPDSQGWRDLSRADRIQFIQRTDRAVFSRAAMDVLASATHCRVVPGHATGVQLDEKEKLLVSVAYQGGDVKQYGPYDLVVWATGTCQSAFLDQLLHPEAKQRLTSTLGVEELTDAALCKHIDASLAIGSVGPKLHLPMLSGVEQGPCFANLSCLGYLSDRILGAYIQGRSCLSAVSIEE